MKENPDSDIIFLEKDYWCISVINFIQSCPLEYGGIGGVTGLRYDALKDFLLLEDRPKGFTDKDVLKKYLKLLSNLGRYYAGLLNKKD